MSAVTLIVVLMTLTGSLYLTARGLHGDGLTFAQKAAMLAVWAVVIAALAYVLGAMSV